MQNTTDSCTARIIHEDRIAEAENTALPENDINRMAVLFKAMGDPNRIRLLSALQRGEMCVCDISVFLGITESAASHQLRVLKSLNLVNFRKEKQCCYYSLSDNHVHELISVCLEHVRHK
jgi:DNA-binding transcriptional ArsR family regulator